MVDIMSKEERSQLMSRIKSKNTGIEKTILKEMKRRKIHGYQYQSKMFGNPDFVFEDLKIAIFCDGDFWHGYGFNSWKPGLNKFWFDKISGNIKRDRKVGQMLRRDGWKTIRLWEHDIEKNPKSCVDRIQDIVEDLNERIVGN